MDDAVDLDVWIQAQNPPVLQEIRQMDAPAGGLFSDDGAAPAKGDDQVTALANGGMRLRAVREEAFSYAAQTALAWRYEKLLAFTKSQEGTLDRIASFNPFVVDDYMLLPSVTEVRDRFEVAPDDQRMRTVRVQYQVSEDPKAISMPPTWRDYLWREFAYPEDPHPTLLPRTDREEQVWKDAIEEGWRDGLRQAQLIWDNNLNEMVRDIRGRITYRILETRGIVRRPVMVGSEPELTYGPGGKVVNAGDTVYSVTMPMEFQSQNNWGALWVSPDATHYDPAFNYEVATPSPVKSASEPVFGEY
ncbi:MAG: defect in organelle trafficking protein DotC [Marinobacter sp. T13-3]|nr:MAG: defect in organelle trafficking protein DotC [Marinobacter sp. T13-3]